MTRLFLSLACAAALLPGTVALPAAVAGEMSVPVKGFLCDSAAHALQFADFRAKGETDEIAKDRVGRGAGAEVCGRYVGIAMIQSEQVSLQGGIAYKVTAFRFREDKRVAWLAERSFAPTDTQWNL